MATMSLLQMTQNILNAMGSDHVESISDTEESEQVAEIIKETFERLMGERDWPFLRTKTTLEANDSGNGIFTCLKIPTNLNKVIWLKYNKKDVTYLSPKDFQDVLDTRTVEANVVDTNGYVLTRDPLYWTSYDEKYIFFDSYDSATESAIDFNKSVVHGVIVPTWTHQDSFVPDVPEKVFSTLLADAKSTCFLNIKQQANAKEEQVAKRGRARLQNEAYKLEHAELTTNKAVNYGRR